MSYNPHYSVGELAKRHLQHSFKKDVAEAIIEEQVKEFEKIIRERVEEELLKVSLGRIESVKSAIEMAEKLYVRIDIDDKTEERTL